LNTNRSYNIVKASIMWFVEALNHHSQFEAPRNYSVFEWTETYEKWKNKNKPAYSYSNAHKYIFSSASSILNISVHKYSDVPTIKTTNGRTLGVFWISTQIKIYYAYRCRIFIHMDTVNFAINYIPHRNSKLVGQTWGLME
jgi:hypothetical protein